MRHLVCWECGVEFEQAGRGRNRKYCVACSDEVSGRQRRENAERWREWGHVSRALHGPFFCAVCRSHVFASSSAGRRRYGTTVCQDGDCYNRYTYRRALRKGQVDATVHRCGACGAEWCRLSRSGSKTCCGSDACVDSLGRPDRGTRKKIREYVMARDRWVCQLCGGKIDSSLDEVSPSYGSVDHIVPKSQGGTEDYSNLQAAHMGCNASKGNRVAGSQMRLVG